MGLKEEEDGRCFDINIKYIMEIILQKTQTSQIIFGTK